MLAITTGRTQGHGRQNLFCLILLACSGCQTLGPKPDLGEIVPVPPLRETPAKKLLPSHDRNWSPDLAVLPYAERRGDQVVVRNIRNCVYQSDNDFVVNYYDKQFDLDDLKSVDFLVVPFKDAPSLAHTMLSFGFDNDQYLAVSAEARLEKHERYSPVLGSLRQYELMYVVADERDVILRRTKHRNVDVFVYRTVATPEQSRELFMNVMERVNRLAESPEYYDTVTNNCTTNIVGHLNQLRPGRIPLDLRVLLPGFSDALAYEVGLLDTKLPYAEARRRARVTDLANRYEHAEDFSARIRR